VDGLRGSWGARLLALQGRTELAGALFFRTPVI